MSDYNSIRQQLRRRRLELGLSQTALGAEIGTSQSHISDLESDHHRATAPVLVRWAEALGFEITVSERAS